MAPQLLSMGTSGGYSGPALPLRCSAGATALPILPAWLQGESNDTPCPAMYGFAVAASGKRQAAGGKRQATSGGARTGTRIALNRSAAMSGPPL
jgi:hypothetical protein